MIPEWDFRKFERERNEKDGRYVGICLGALAIFYLGACTPAAALAPDTETPSCVTGGLTTKNADTTAAVKGACTDTLHLPTHGARL